MYYQQKTVKDTDIIPTASEKEDDHSIDNFFTEIQSKFEAPENKTDVEKVISSNIIQTIGGLHIVNENVHL
jgi:hypothetical protein